MTAQAALPMHEDDAQNVAERLWAVLTIHCRGRDRAMTRAELCRWCECSDRVLRRAKELLVRSGHPVGMVTRAPGGYYWVTSPEELERTKRQHRARLIAAARALKGLENGGLGQAVLDLAGRN